MLKISRLGLSELCLCSVLMADDAFQIRPYRDCDRKDIVALWEACFSVQRLHHAPEAVIAKKSAIQPDLFLVGALGGRSICTALAGFDGYRGWVYRVATHPDYRRRGYGRQMMAEVERRLSVMGCPKLNLQVYATNREAVGFYARLGYTVEDRVSLGKVLKNS